MDVASFDSRILLLKRDKRWVTMWVYLYFDFYDGCREDGYDESVVEGNDVDVVGSADDSEPEAELELERLLCMTLGTFDDEPKLKS